VDVEERDPVVRRYRHARRDSTGDSGWGPGLPDQPPASLKYLPAKAWYVLPETHSEEGHSSLCEGKNGKIYIGTTKEGVDSYLVEFDPVRETQQIVIDVHKLCGLVATGFAAQSKIHTPNFVGPSGKIYLGSKEGYANADDKKNHVHYPGGYVMTYDPAADQAENLGMPFPRAADMTDGEGVIDVAADEGRGLIYVVTCEQQHWTAYDMAAKKYMEPDPSLRLVNYATTLIDSRVIASAIAVETTDEPEVDGFKPQQFRRAQYNPTTGKVTVRDLALDGRKWLRLSRDGDLPEWSLAPDGHIAWLVRLGNATVISIDLLTQGETVPALSRGKLLEDEGIDIRCGLTFHPDGCIYSICVVANNTGFGSARLEKLARFNLKTCKSEDLGVVTISNPEFYDKAVMLPNGTKKNWSHGFVELPDKTLAATINMTLRAAHDGTLYATQIYPFSLLRFDQFRLPATDRKRDAANER
jgi:hypothetical protein